MELVFNFSKASFILREKALNETTAHSVGVDNISDLSNTVTETHQHSKTDSIWELISLPLQEKKHFKINIDCSV